MIIVFRISIKARGGSSTGTQRTTESRVQPNFHRRDVQVDFVSGASRYLRSAERIVLRKSHRRHGLPP